MTLLTLFDSRINADVQVLTPALSTFAGVMGKGFIIFLIVFGIVMAALLIALVVSMRQILRKDKKEE